MLIAGENKDFAIFAFGFCVVSTVYGYLNDVSSENAKNAHIGEERRGICDNRRNNFSVSFCDVNVGSKKYLPSLVTE